MATEMSWCPKIYFNRRCFCGPYFNSNKVSEMTEYVGQGPILLVMRTLVEKLVDVAMKPSDLLKLVAKKDPENDDKSGKQKTDDDDLYKYFRTLCRKFKCCPSFISVIKFDGECMDGCKLDTKRDNHWCPRIYFNSSCACGPFLDSAKVGDLRKHLGPGPITDVVKKLVIQLVSVSADKSALLEKLRVNDAHASQKVIHVRGGKETYAIAYAVGNEELFLYFHQLCQKLECCPYFITIIDIDGECHAQGDENRQAKSAEKSKQADMGFAKILLPVAAAVGAMVAAPFVLAAAGFGVGGIAAGSFAAKMMSMAAVANGGGVAAGGIIAGLQSAGAVGIGASASTVIGGVAAGFTRAGMWLFDKTSSETESELLLCPKIHFNRRCFCGPHIDRKKMLELPEHIGPGPIPDVMNAMRYNLADAAVKPSVVLKLISDADRSMESTENKTKKDIKNDKGVQKELLTYFHQLRLKLECCPHFITIGDVAVECLGRCQKNK